MNNSIEENINKDLSLGSPLYWVLLDPDDYSIKRGAEVAKQAESCGANAILIGGSLLYNDYFDKFVKSVSEVVGIPVILFPGDSSQVSGYADGILFTSLLSGRNSDFLIGEQVKGAARVKANNIEPIPTAYLLVESGKVTSVEFMSNTRPLPRDKPGIAAMHALAAQYMGQRLIYLEAGSGAKYSVPPTIIEAVKKQVDIPVIVGGGIRDSETVLEKLNAGADIIVTGNILNNENGLELMKEIAKTISNYNRNS